ncbi:MAG: plasmid recombination protein, partial [Oscillospiraceae bacterium]|nr:plasmid recombination protein [Oscillospiraceae bacterium]
MQKTLSITIGKGSIGHNNRAFFADNIDSSRSQNNIIFHKEDIKKVYQELFGTALAEYNAKQKRKDRIIKDYYDHIFHSKQEKPFYELIIQVGNKDDTPCNSDDGKLAAQILIEFEKEFQKRNPHIRVFNSVLHMDEHTPHLHIDFVPFSTNQKRGLSTRNALTKALEQQGFIAKGRFDTSSKLWIDSEKEKLSEIMKRYGIEWKKLGTHNNHLSVLDFKKQERKKEILRLENKIECTDNILKSRQELLDDTERIIDELDGEYQEKKENISRLDDEIMEKENVLSETISIISTNNSLIEASADKVSKIKNIDDIQARKTLFGDNVTVSQEDYNN